MYILVWGDRHHDVEVEVFTYLANSVAYAEKIIEDNIQDGHEPDRTLNDAMRESGWVYFCTYSDEGDDYVFIKQVEPDPKPE